MSTLLLVDDDAFNREGIRLYLKGQGFDVVEAGDAETAWSIAQAGGLEAAVVDISIPPDPRTPSSPGHSFGVALARRIKEAQPALGVVLFSAYEDRGSDVLEMVRVGMRGLAYKPKGSQPGALLAAIHDVMAGRVVIDPEVHANRRGLADELLKHLTPDERKWVEIAVASFNQLTQIITYRTPLFHTKPFANIFQCCAILIEAMARQRNRQRRIRQDPRLLLTYNNPFHKTLPWVCVR